MGKVVTTIIKIAIVAISIAAVIVSLGSGGYLVLSTFGKIFVGIGAAIVLGEINKLLAPKIDAQSGAKEEVRSPVAPRNLVYGHQRIAGALVYAGTHGTDNKFLTMVFVVAADEINTFEKWFVDDKEVTLDGGGNVTSGQYANKVRIRTRVGAAIQAAEAGMVSDITEWTTAHQLNGLAYYAVRYTYDAEVFVSGRPRINTLVQGHMLYDPRLDSTVPGGSGAHRENDPATWEWADNWALVIYDYLRRDPLGSRMPNSWIDVQEVIVAANISDENVTLKAGGTQKRYTLNGIASSVIKRDQNLDEMLVAGAGRLVYQEGLFKLYAGAATTANIPFDEDELAGPVHVITAKPRRDLFNRVTGRFLDDTNDLYESNDYPAVVDSAAETADGEILELNLDLGWVQDNIRAQRVAQIVLNENRKQVSAQMSVNLKGLQVKAWSVIKVTNARFGWTDELFRVVGWQRNPNGSIHMALNSYAADIYAWDETTQEQDAKPLSIPTIDDGLSAPDVTTLVVTPSVHEGPDGTKLPALNVTWDAPELIVGSTQILFRIDGETWNKTIPLIDPQTAEYEITGLLPGTTYDVQVRHRTWFQVFGTYNIKQDTVTLTESFIAGDSVTVAGEPSVNALRNALTFLEFPGANGDVVQIADNNQWEPAAADAFTVEAWIYLNDIGATQIFMAKRESGAPNLGWELQYVVSTGIRLVIDVGASTLLITHDTAIVANQWYHVAFTRTTGGLYTLYVDAVADATTISDATDLTNTISLLFGDRIVGGTLPFDGRMQDVRIWSTTRTAQEIADNKQQILDGTESGLEGLWRLDEGTGVLTQNRGAVGSPTGDGDLLGDVFWGGAAGYGISAVNTPMFGFRAGFSESGTVAGGQVAVISYNNKNEPVHDASALIPVDGTLVNVDSGEAGETAIISSPISDRAYYIAFDASLAKRFTHGSATNRDFGVCRLIAGNLQYWQSTVSDDWTDLAIDDDIVFVGECIVSSSVLVAASAYAQGIRPDAAPELGASVNRPPFGLRAGFNAIGNVEAPKIAIIGFDDVGILTHDSSVPFIPVGDVLVAVEDGTNGETSTAAPANIGAGTFYLVYDATLANRFTHSGSTGNRNMAVCQQIHGGIWQYWETHSVTDQWTTFTVDDDYVAIGFAANNGTTWTTATAYAEGKLLVGLPELIATANTGDLADLDQADTPEIVDDATTGSATASDSSTVNLTDTQDSDYVTVAYTETDETNKFTADVIVEMAGTADMDIEYAVVPTLGAGRINSLRITAEINTYTLVTHPTEVAGDIGNSYDLNIKNVNGSGTLTITFARLTITETKK